MRSSSSGLRLARSVGGEITVMPANTGGHFALTLPLAA
jgi:hypothetical protein